MTSPVPVWRSRWPVTARWRPLHRIADNNGVFDGPIPIRTATMLDMCFDRLNLETRQVERFDAGS